MSTKNIYFGTMKFILGKLLLGLAGLVICGILGLICIPLVTKLGMFPIVIWLLLSIAAYGLINHYFGYLLKAGHIAVITKAVVDGALPEDMWNYGVQSVKKRFITTNVYYIIDNSINGAVKQINKVVDKADDLFGKIPGVSTLLAFAKVFIGIALGYIDECCLGYTFLHMEENAFKCACDGVVIYFQNWKKLLKSAAITSLMVVGLTFIFTLIPFLLIGGLFALLDVSFIFALIPAIFLAIALKDSFLDSFILIRTMKAYMEVAPSTELKVDIYDKLCKLSSKFKNMFNKSKEPMQV